MDDHLIATLKDQDHRLQQARSGGPSRSEVGQRSPDRLGPAHVALGCRRVEGVELLGGQPDRYDLHRFSPTTRTPTTPTLQLIDVVSGFGLVGPLLDLFFAHHTHIV